MSTNHTGTTDPSTQRWIALLRAINVGGRRLPMAQLRELALRLGWQQPCSYLQSGNLQFSATQSSPARLERALEDALAEHCGFEVPVLVRSQSQWRELAAGNPFADAALARPQLLMLGLAKAPLQTDSAERLQALAEDGERVRQVGEALWIDFAAGSARSKLSPSRIDRCAGSPVTTRNWRTVCALQQSLA